MTKDNLEHMKEKPSTPKKWGPVSSILLTVLIFFASQIVASYLILAVFLALGKNSQQFEAAFEAHTALKFLYLLLADTLVITAIAALLKRRNMKFSEIGIVDRPGLQDIGRALLAFVGYIGIFVALATLAKILIPGLNLEQQQQLGFGESKSAFDLVLIGLSLVVLPPIAEEILCRGFLYTGLKSRLKYWPAAIITSIIFATAHLQFGSGAPLLWVGAMDTFVLSMFLVYLRESTGKLWSSMALHMLKNGLAFTLLFIVGVR